MYHVLVPDNVDQQAVKLLVDHPQFSVNAPGKMNRGDTLAAVDDVHALIIRSGTTVDVELMEAAPQLKFVARAGVGVDNIDLDAATERGIIVMNTPGGNTVATAEHALGLMLALARHIPQGHQSLAEGRWDRKLYMGVELRGKTLGIIGFGRVGKTLARLASAFDMNIIAYDPNPDIGGAEKLNVELVDLGTLYAQADFISLHSVYSDDTHHTINADSIKQMKDGARLVNTARGGLIDEAALAKAVRDGKLAGVAVDVYSEEPPSPDHPLLGLDNVIHTPHLAASTTDAQVQVGLDAANQIIDAMTNADYRHVVNMAVLDK